MIAALSFILSLTGWLVLARSQKQPRTHRLARLALRFAGSALLMLAVAPTPLTQGETGIVEAIGLAMIAALVAVAILTGIRQRNGC